jgi:hypothetical protein
MRQEVDWRSLGELKIGDAGDLDRKESTVYEMTVEYMDEGTGLTCKAYSFLCNWDPEEHTFETKYNALFVGLVEDQVRVHVCTRISTLLH